MFDQARREIMEPAARERALMAALPEHVAHAKRCSSTQAIRLHHIDAAEVSSREELTRLPLLRKRDLMYEQGRRRAGDPFGGFAASGWRGLAGTRRARRVFQSPGPLYEPEGEGLDPWRMSRAMAAAGFADGDLVHNSFSYHLTPAGAMMESGALALGCTVFPGGVGQTELQLAAILDLQPHAYVGTPSFLKILTEQAESRGMLLGNVTKALVSGEAFPPSMREWLQGRGIQAFQAYATADVGLIAYETKAREGLVLDEDVILEIVDPVSAEPVPPGDIGEVVITALNKDYPLIRLATGDLSAILPGRCPTGRTNTRIRGWLGRADQATKVRGMFVHPEHVAKVAQRHPQILKARLVIDGSIAEERLVLQVEAQSPSTELAAALVSSIREITKLRGEVAFVQPGQLAPDGKMIEDRRRYD